MFKPGQCLGDYAVLQELGKGGYGRVYKVEHTITGRREAMKVLAAGDANAADQSERFLREIRLQASLSHPNIAVVHTAFWVNDDLALVCELLEGQSLQQLLERQQPPREQALEITMQVLEALSYAHARGIIHRDISPANIFLTVGGTVKIIDFGLAKAATDLRLTREGSPIGAAHYMSPEQIRGAQDIDARTDIYSCGVVLYELVAGRKPFEGDNAFDIMKAHTEEPPSPPTTPDSQIVGPLSAIILRALAKKPEERFQSADAFLQAIKQLQTEPAKASTQFSQRRSVLVAAAVVLTILIGTLAATLTTRRGSAQSQALKAVVVPPPAPAVEARPVIPEVATPPTASASPAKKLRQRTTPRNAVKTEALNTPSKNDGGLMAPPAPPAEVKPRTGVAKIGGVLKRINPFQKNNSASGKDDPGK